MFFAENFNSWTSNGETFEFYYILLLVSFGTIGNSLSVYVFFQSRKLRHHSSSYYLSALAISDTIFLFSIFMVWFRFFEVDLFNHEGTCQTIIYVTGVCNFLSVWLVVSFTIERFIAVRYPMIQRSVCTVSRAKLVVLGLVMFSMILYIPSIYLAAIINHSGTYECGIQKEFANLANIFNYIDTFLSFLAPITIIVILNLWMRRTVSHLTKIRREMILRKDRFKQTSDSLKLKYANTMSHKNNTKMILMVSTVFLCLNFPNYLLRIIAYLIEVKAIKQFSSYPLHQLQQWCQLLFYTNFGINFVLYCVGGNNFRKALRNLMKVKRQQRGGGCEIIILADTPVQSNGGSPTSARRKDNQPTFELRK